MAKVQTELVNTMDTMYQEFMAMANEDLFKGSAKTIKGMKDFTTRGLSQMSEQLQKGNYAIVRQLKSAQQKMDAGFAESMSQLSKAQKAYQLAVASGDEARIEATKRSVQQVESRVQTVMKQTTQARKEMNLFASQLEAGQEKITQTLKDREERIKELGKTGQVFQEHFADNLEKASEKFQDGFKDMDSLGKTLQSTFSSLGGVLDKMSAKSAEKADKSGGGLGMAKFLGNMGKFLKVMAVVGGSIMALVAIFNFVEGQVLEANKAILEQNSVLDTVALGSEDLADNLERARNAFNDGRFANELGVARDEIAKMAGEMNQVNLGFAYFGGNLELQKRSMKQLQGFSKAMGISFGDASAYMANFAENMGIGAEHGSVYGKIARDFADIRDIALQTSYSTANFFNKVKDLTDSLENMGLRTEEAANLFVRFSKILGPEGAQAMLQGLGMGFKGEGWLDMIKRQLLTKGEDIGKVLEVDAKRQAQSLIEAYGGKAGRQDSEGMTILRRTLGIEGKLDQESLAGGLAGLGTKQIQALLSELARGNKESQGLGQQLVGLIDVAKGAKGDRTARSRGMASAGAGAQTAINFAKLKNALRGRDLRGMSDIQLEGISNITGIEQEQLKMFQRTQDVLKGNLAFAQDQAKNYRTMTAEQRAETDKKLADMGLVINAQGKVALKDQQDKEVKDLVDMFMAQGAGRDETEVERVKTTEDYLAENVVATMSISDQINNHLGGLLQDISTGIYELVNWFFGKNGNKEEKKQAMETLKVEQRKNLDQQKTLTAEIAEQKMKVKDAELRLKESENYKKADAETRKEMLANLDERKSLQDKEKSLEDKRAEASQLREAKAYINRSEKGTAKDILAEARLKGRASLALSGDRVGAGTTEETQAKIDQMTQIAGEYGFDSFEALGKAMENMGEKEAQRIAQELKSKYDIDTFQQTNFGLYDTTTQESVSSLSDPRLKDKGRINTRKGFSFMKGEETLGGGGFMTKELTNAIFEKALENRGMTREQYSKGLRGRHKDIKSIEVNEEFKKLAEEISAGTAEALIKVQELQEKSKGERKTEVKEDTKAQAEEQAKHEGKLEQKRLKERDKHKLRNLAGSMGVQGDLSALSDDEVIRRLKQQGPLSASRAEQLQSLGVNTEGFTITKADGATPSVEKGNDVLLSGGRLVKLDSADQVLALKPGGAVSKAMGGGIVNHFTINGAGDPQGVAKQVASYMEQSQRSRIGGSR